MKIQRLFKDIPEDIKSLEPFASWQELSPVFYIEKVDDCSLVVAKIEDENFDSLLGIFRSREEAIGAFLAFAFEHGWEEVPESFCIYHTQESNGKIIAGLLWKGRINLYEQSTVEQMIQTMARVHRIVVYSYEVVSYIKDIYPDIDKKVYSIAREIAKRLGKAPELEELAKIYGVSLKDLEDKLKFIEKLLENPVKTPFGEVRLPPVSLPVVGCE